MRRQTPLTHGVVHGRGDSARKQGDVEHVWAVVREGGKTA